MKINQLEFVSGSSGSDKPLIVEPKRITVFVGPNNSGKSQVLEEINKWLCGGNPDLKVLSRIGINLPDFQKIEKWLLGLDVSKRIDEKYIELKRPSFLGEELQSHRLNLIGDIRSQLEAWENNQDENAFAIIRTNTLRWATIRIEGRNIFSLASERELGDLGGPPTSHLVKLFKDVDKRKKWREMCGRAFPDMNVAIDHTSRQLKIKMADRPPRQEEETGLDAPAIEFHRQATPIQSTGDGVYAFTGLSSVLVGYDWRFLLIDDPEVYLHPPVARKLGFDISTISKLNDAQVFVSTHSSYFLQGCLDVCDEVTIIRLTFNSKTKDSTSYCLPTDKVRKLASHPLLKSTRVFDALFHEAVIVTEGDTDRVFYEEMNRMLLEHQRGHHECLFICPHSRDVVGEIASPLTSLGIPTAAIVDLDFLWDGKKKWNELLVAMKITDDCKQTINQLSNSVKQDMKNESVTRDDFKNNGIWPLNEDIRSRLQSLFDLLGENGIFCVPGGQLESWFSELPIRGGNKSEKMMDCLEKVKDKDPIRYTTPDNHLTAWEFMDSVTYWLKTGRIRDIPKSSKFRIPVNETENIAIRKSFQRKFLLNQFVLFANMKAGGSIFFGLGSKGEVIGLKSTFKRYRVSSIEEFGEMLQKIIINEFGMEVLPFVSIIYRHVDDEVFCEVVIMHIPEFGEDDWKTKQTRKWV